MTAVILCIQNGVTYKLGSGNYLRRLGVFGREEKAPMEPL